MKSGNRTFIFISMPTFVRPLQKQLLGKNGDTAAETEQCRFSSCISSLMSSDTSHSVSAAAYEYSSWRRGSRSMSRLFGCQCTTSLSRRMHVRRADRADDWQAFRVCFMSFVLCPPLFQAGRMWPCFVSEWARTVFSCK